jgi:hypothetical protein
LGALQARCGAEYPANSLTFSHFALGRTSLRRDDAPDYETLEDAAPVASQTHSIDVIDGAGGNSLLDVCAPTPIVMAAVALIMEQLAALPTA